MSALLIKNAQLMYCTPKTIFNDKYFMYDVILDKRTKPSICKF